MCPNARLKSSRYYYQYLEIKAHQPKSSVFEPHLDSNFAKTFVQYACKYMSLIPGHF